MCTPWVCSVYRASAFNWSARLLLLGARILTTVYSLRPNIALATRQAAVPELHLALETWYHELPSHLRASGTDPKAAPHAHIIALNLTYYNMHVLLHRPFFRRHAPGAPLGTNISTDKCLVAAAHIVRLVKLLKNSSGLRLSPNGVQHAAFCAGTILAISAVEDGISDSAKQDQDRRAGARRDLRFLVEALKEMGQTWTTSATSAAVLECESHVNMNDWLLGLTELTLWVVLFLSALVAALMMTWGSESVPQSATGGARHAPDRRASMSGAGGSQNSHSPDLSVSELGSDPYPTPDLATIPLPSLVPSGLAGAWPAGDRAGLLNDPLLPGGGAKLGGASLADGSDPFTFIFPSWALDSGETSGFVSMLNPVLNPDGVGYGEEDGEEFGGGSGHEGGEREGVYA